MLEGQIQNNNWIVKNENVICFMLSWINKVAALTLFVLLFITAEGDHRFLGLASFLRCHKTVIAVARNWRLRLTCNQNKNSFPASTFAHSRTREGETLWELTSLCPRTASGRQRCTCDRLLSGSSFFLVLLIHLRTLYILQPPCVNRSQPLFKLIYLGLGRQSVNHQ